MEICSDHGCLFYGCKEEESGCPMCELENEAED